MQPLPGFRDFLPSDCAARNYIFAKWREAARRYGFVEWDGPVLEPTELYKKKSGDEIVGQLFNFTDKGGREVALRPELTPTLARVVTAHEREFRKPLKWFSIGQFFRYEKQQRGRLREHFQLNCDIIGEKSPAADGELIALAIDILRSFGFTEQDFVVRVSSRNVWESFLQERRIGSQGYTGTELETLLSVVDRMDKHDDQHLAKELSPIDISLSEIRDWISVWNKKIFESDSVQGNTSLARLHAMLHEQLLPRGLLDYIAVDFSIVRGLAYYTGIVFEVFDRSKKLRAIAGGGRYDDLIGQLSDGAVLMPGIGFAMGDVVLGELIKDTSHARLQMHNQFQWNLWIDVYVVVAKEERRGDALSIVQTLRDRYCPALHRNYRVSYSLTAEKVAKQFQNAEALGARVFVVIGDEWPDIRVKFQHTREEKRVPNQLLFEHLQTLMETAVQGDQFVAEL